MFGRQLLFEADSRSLAQKMRDLIDHPNTLEPVREVARRKLQQYLEKEAVAQAIPPTIAQTFKPTVKPRTVTTNLSDDDLDKIFYFGCNFTCRYVYDNLRSLSPVPSDILFMRQGIIHIMVPPPYMGLTKTQFSDKVLAAVPGAKNITCKFVEDKGYHFTISLI